MTEASGLHLRGQEHCTEEIVLTQATDFGEAPLGSV